ncbi:hypothetical protein ML437_08550 [Staphylococcus roterodami]|nr:hypothetical protein ML437_08550 [Staphylococcus roterodami]
MMFITGIVISLVVILIASYFSFVLTTLIISEDFSDRVTLKVAFILPIILISLSIHACLENLRSNKQLAKTAFKMATTQYPSVVTMFIGMVKDHQAQVRCFGESTYTYNQNKENPILKKDINKSWLNSLKNLKSLIKSEGFKKNFLNNLAEA